MHNNLRSGVRQAQKHTLALSSYSVQAVRPPVPGVSTSNQTRAIAQSSTSQRAIPFSLNSYGPQPDERDERRVRMLMFGKPGAGKGTLTYRLSQKYDILHISTGDLIRQEIANRTNIGIEAEDIVARGGLLPDEMVLKIVTSKLDSLQNKNWVLDGFPRTVGQAELLDAHLKKRNTPLTLVVNLDVPDEVIMSRISDRWVHPASGRVYNMSYNRPRVEGFDDQTGEPLTKRPDDNPEIFARRLAAFYASTSPLLSYFSESANSTNAKRRNSFQHPHQLTFSPPSGLKIKSLSGTTSDQIWPHLDRLLHNTFPGLREKLEPKDMRTRRLVSNAVAAELGANPLS